MRLTRRNILAGAAAATALGLAGPVLAQASLNAEQRRLVERAQTYLNSMSSVRGRFSETGPRGQRASGAFYLRRPGRMRFEYDAPSQLVVTADGSFIHRWDPRLEVYQRLPTNQTPLSLLLDNNAGFSNRYIRIEDVTATSDGCQITLRDSRRPREGSLTLVFGGSTYRLREWTVRDAQGAATRVQLTTIMPVSSLADSLFRNPRSS
ncbi:MAG: outer membrane lipoprotein carrier protein LolA [Caulobacterales bacterium]|nr:outer membrane lipoprotein carrier protein LolA [Caulobacterales bacterium]